MNLAIAAANDMETWQVDYVAAYLNSKPQAEIYIELPEGGRVQGKIGKLNRTLYGTMDGAYNWWETLDAEMSELGITGPKQIHRFVLDMRMGTSLLRVPTRTIQLVFHRHLPKLGEQRRNWVGTM